MKKFLSIALALVMTLALAVTCFAANETGLTPEQNATNDVTATYAATANDETALYAVDVAFGAMAFTYTDAAKTWNPVSHQYELQGATGVWTCETNANKITVTNHSNAAVVANLSYAAEDAYNTIAASFVDAEGAAIEEDALNLGSAAAGNAAVVADAYLKLNGALAAGEGVKLGTITVAIAAAQ